MLQFERHFIESVQTENMETEHRKRKRRIKMLRQYRTVCRECSKTFFISFFIFFILIFTDEAASKECSVNIGELIA